MKMTKENLLHLLIGLLTGILLTLIVTVYAVNNHHEGMMKAMGMDTNQSMQMNDQNMPGMDHGGM
jgi:imidazoleglycerol phosphate dehydratase HisB